MRCRALRAGSRAFPWDTLEPAPVPAPAEHEALQCQPAQGCDPNISGSDPEGALERSRLGRLQISSQVWSPGRGVAGLDLP